MRVQDWSLQGPRTGTSAPTRSLVAGMLPRPNTAASVKGCEVLHMPNQWAHDSCAGLDEKSLLEMVKQ